MGAGLIQSLVGFLEAHLAALGTQHRCPPPSSSLPFTEDSEHEPAAAADDTSRNAGETDANKVDLSPSEPPTTDDNNTSSVDREAILPVAVDKPSVAEPPVPAGPVFRITSPSYQVGCAGFAYIFFRFKEKKKSPTFRVVSL
jgi:hypothetical protein